MTDRSSKTLLVIEDDGDLRGIMVRSLARQGFKVLAAEGGHDAVEILKVNHVDLIVSDVRMARGDGLSVLDYVRQRDPGFPPLIFVTGFSQTNEKEFLDRGANMVLQKPVPHKDLLSAIESLLF